MPREGDWPLDSPADLNKDPLQKGHGRASEGHSKNHFPNKMPQLKFCCFAGPKQSRSQLQDTQFLVMGRLKGPSDTINIPTLEASVHSTNQAFSLIEREAELIAGVHKPLVPMRWAPFKDSAVPGLHLPQLVIAVQVHHRDRIVRGEPFQLGYFGRLWDTAQAEHKCADHRLHQRHAVDPAHWNNAHTHISALGLSTPKNCPADLLGKGAVTQPLIRELEQVETTREIFAVDQHLFIFVVNLHHGHLAQVRQVTIMARHVLLVGIRRYQNGDEPLQQLLFTTHLLHLFDSTSPIQDWVTIVVPEELGFRYLSHHTPFDSGADYCFPLSVGSSHPADRGFFRPSPLRQTTSPRVAQPLSHFRRDKLQGLLDRSFPWPRPAWDDPFRHQVLHVLYRLTTVVKVDTSDRLLALGKGLQLTALSLEFLHRLMQTGDHQLLGW